MHVWTRGLGEGGFDGLREALEAVDHGDEDILDAPVAQVAQDFRPEFGAFTGLKPKAQDVARAIWQDCQRDEDRLVADRPIAADIDPDRVHEHHRIARLQWAVLPGGDLIHDGLGDRRNQAGGCLEAVDFFDVPLNFPGRHATRIHADNLAVELREPALILGDQQRIEGAVAVARDVQNDLPAVGGHRLLAAAIAAIGRPVRAIRRFFGALIAKMFLHLGRQRAFRQRFRQFGKNAFLTEKIAGRTAFHQSIQ